MDIHCYSTENPIDSATPLSSEYTLTVNCPPNGSLTLDLPINITGISKQSTTSAFLHPVKREIIKPNQAKVQEIPCSASRRRNLLSAPERVQNGHHDETDRSPVNFETITADRVEVQEIPCSASRRRNLLSAPPPRENGHHDETDRSPINFETITPDRVEVQEIPCSANRRKNLLSAPTTYNKQNGDISVSVETTTEFLDTVDSKSYEPTFKDDDAYGEDREPVHFEMIIPESVKPQKLDCPASRRKNLL